MAVGGLHYHQVAGLDSLAGGIDVYPFPGVLETHLEKVLELFLGDSFKPVVVLQLAASPAVAAFRGAGFLVLGHRAAAVAVEPYVFVVSILHLESKT